MRRRVFILAMALALVVTLAAGVIRAKAAGTPDKPTIKVIVLVKPGGSTTAVMRELKDRNAAAVVPYHIIPAVSATVSQATLAALRKDGNVLKVVNDRRVPAPKVPPGAEGKLALGESSARSASQAPMESEALQLTHAQDAWSVKVNGQPVKGQGVRVGMLDTGTDRTHPDLAPAIEAYRDFTGAGLQDNFGHGTATSGCVAAQGLPVYNPETATTMRVSGMAPRAKVLMAKVIDVSGGWDSQFMRGIQWLVDQKVDIISCSLSALVIPADGNDPSALAVQAAIDSGITFVNSEGNEGPGQGTLGSSQDRKDVLAVGASTGAREFSQIGFMVDGSAYKGDQVITWSSRGPNSVGDFKPDIMGFGAYGWALAPAAGDAYGDYGIQEFGGTSMAAPVVAGDLALAESAWKMTHPGKALPAPAYWKKLLASTATDLGYPALDQSSGLVNAKAAVRAVLKRGKSMLVGVTADSHNASSWSPKLTGGAHSSTKIVVKNTGGRTEKVKLTPTTYVVDKSKTITRTITLTADGDYSDSEDLTVPSGTDFVQVRCTWPSGPDVSIRTAVYDSDGNFLTYAPTYGGYGHLSCDQISLRGPQDQRPVVKKGEPWQVSIFPRASMPPTSPQQVNLRVEFLHKARWSRVKLASPSISLKPGHSASIRATVTAPKSAGTFFGGIIASNGSTKTTIPLAIRVPVKISGGQGSFSGRLTGSTVEYFGGEFYFYDFTVPKGTKSVAAQVTWPDEGNLVNVYLVDPKGHTRDAKGGDLWVPDYANLEVPDAALTHTAEQVLWDAPVAGKWQVLIWAPGFSGNGFSEPFSGTITLDRGVVSPTAWTATAAPGDTVDGEFTVANAGPTDLAAYASSQVAYNGTALFDDFWYKPFDGTLTPDVDGFYTVGEFWLPQNTAMVTASAVWTSETSTLVDLGLYDPTGTDTAESLATTDMGNAVVVPNPMSGLWTLTVGYGNPDRSPPPVGFEIQVDYVAPLEIDGLTTAATYEEPLIVAKGGSGTIDASITVPPDALPGDTITGALDFYTSDDQVQTAGGDHLGSVPVTITVAGPSK